MKKLYWLLYILTAAVGVLLMTICAKQDARFGAELLMFIVCWPWVCRNIARGLCDVVKDYRHYHQ